MKLYRINTTAFEEEDFQIMSNLSEEDIVDVIKPIVLAERERAIDYDNEFLFKALVKAFPRKKIILVEEEEYITF